MPSAYGIQFQRSADSGTSYSKIAGLKAIEPGERSREAFEVQAVDKESGDANYGWKEFEASPLKDAGELTLTLIGGLVGHDDLHTDFEDSTDPGYYRVVYPGSVNRQITFRGVITSISDPTTAENDQVTYSVKIKRSGEPVEAPIT